MNIAETIIEGFQMWGIAPLIGGAMISGGASLLGGILGMNKGQQEADRRQREQFEQQKQLMDKQLTNQKELNIQGQELGMDYSKQRGKLEEAGLNAGLMYSGGAGSTGGSGGSATGGSAPSFDNTNSQYGQLGMELGTRLALMGAQKQNIEADTKLKEIDANKKAGVDTENVIAGTGNIEADTALKNLQSENQKLQNNITNMNTEEIINTVYANARKAEAEAGIATVNANVMTETQKDRVKQIKAEAIGAVLDNLLKKENISYTQAQTKAVAEQVLQGWLNANSNRTNARANQKNADTNADVNLRKQIQDALYQNGVLELGDRKLNQDMIMGISSMLMGRAPSTSETINRGADGEYQGSSTTKRE